VLGHLRHPVGQGAVFLQALDDPPAYRTPASRIRASTMIATQKA